MMRIYASISAILVLAMPGWAGEKADCHCVYAGGRVLEGETACILTTKGPELARCDKFLNNTSWVPLGQPCVPEKLSAIPKDQSQAIDIAGK
jgi:hypothetical protein